MTPNNSMQTRPSLDEIFGDAPAAVDETQPLPATDAEIPEPNVTSDYSQLPTSSFMSEEAQAKKAIDTNIPMVQNTIEHNTTEQNARKEHFAKMANDEEYRDNYLRELGYKDSDDYRKKTADRLESVLNVIKSNIPDSRFVDYAVYEHSMPVRPMEETIATRQAKKVQEAINTLRSNNFWRGLAEGFDLNDIASLGFAQVGDNVMALNALNKARKGEELTQTEQSLVDAWKLGQQVEGEISMLGGRDLGANIGYGFGQSMPFVAEMIATGGVASAATKGISKAIAKRGIQEAAEEFVKAGSQKKIKEATSKQIVKGLEKAGLHLAESVVGGAARMPLVGGVYNNYTGKRLEQFALEDDKIKKYATPAWKDAMKAGFETWTEYFTEDIGKWMDAPLGKVGNSLAHSPFGKKIHLDRIADYKGNKFLTSLRDAAKINGLPAEMAEEVMNDVLLNTFYNDKEGWREMASSDYWWQLAGVSALMQGAFVLPNMVSSGQRDYNNRVKELERIKKESLEAIKDPELKAKVAKAGAASSIVERSGILSTIDWKRKKFTKQDAFNAVKYINAQTEFDIAEGESAETERLSRFFDTAQFLGDGAYRGVDGKEDTGDIVQISDDKGNAYCVISGDIDSNNPDTILKARDIKGKVWDVPMYSVVKVDRNSISEGIAQAYAMMFNQQVNQEQLDALQTRISEAVAAGVSTNDVKDILRNNKIEVFEKGDVVRLNDGRLARVDGLNGDHYVVVTADESGTPNVESIGINDMPQTKALGNVAQEEATPEETAPEQPAEATPQSAPVNQAVEAVVVEAERAIDQRIDASANVADGNVYNCVLEDESEVVIRNGNVVLTENGEIDLAKSDQTVVVEYPDGRKRTVAPSQISHITNVENAEQAKENAHAELREVVAQAVEPTMQEEVVPETAPEGEAVAEEVAVTPEPTESVEIPTQETTAPVEVDTAAAPEAPELPRTKDGNVDYESIVDPEVYATSLEEELGTPDAALEAVETSIDGYAAEVTQLRDKAKKEKKISDRVALSKKADAIETYLGTLNEVKNILSKEVRVINGLAEALGLTVEYVDEVDGGRANAQILGDKVQIARYGRDLDKTIKFLIGHEFTHRLQDLSPEAYAQFKAAVIEHLDWRFEDEVKKLREIYNRQGRYPATETLEDEVVADFAGQLATTTEVFDAFVESHPVSKWQQMWEKVLEVLQNIASYFTAEDVHQATLNNTIVKLSSLLESASAKVSEENAEEVPDTEGATYSDVHYSIKETNPEVLEQLNNGETIKVYRAMQVIDGKLYPPMSAKVDGKLREPIELGVWERAEERPDLADEKGYFKLDKGNKTSLKARYNPYIHTSLTPLNDQFSSAQDRPNLVTVEVEVPKSELTSGYKADKAKDSVGQLEWKAGVLQSQLSGTRTVVLSRWDRPLRIVPDSEVAKRIVEMFGDTKVTMPSNVVTPSLRAELEKLGVPFKETDNQGKNKDNVRYAVKSGLSITEEMQNIIDTAKANGTYLKAPNGADTNLTPRQWVQVRTKAFKDWFGDWELLYKIVNVIPLANEHPFDTTKKIQEVKRDAVKYAKAAGIIRTLTNEETNGKGEIIIPVKAIRKIVDDAYRSKVNKDIMLDAITYLPQLIRESHLAEAHFSYDKGSDDVRRPENGINPKETIFRYFGAVKKDGKVYRTKITIKKDNGNRSQRAYTYEIMKIELTSGNTDSKIKDIPTLDNSISFAKLLQNVENDKKNGEKLLDFSKVVDENGEPKVVYHGTPNIFTAFDKTKRGSSTDRGIWGSGFYFSASSEYAGTYAKRNGVEGETMSLFLDLKNPLFISLKNGGNEGAMYFNTLQQKYFNDDVYEDIYKVEENMARAQEAMTNEIISAGYDGIIIEYSHPSIADEEYMVFEPNQIKSATDNVGTFDANNPDVHYSVKTAPVFYSNAENAVRNIKQEKATPEQWLKMIEKNGGLKAGEDKWLGLSDWLKASDKKTLTKDEVMEYINQNQIQIEEVKYSEFGPGLIDEAANKLTRELQEIGIDGLREKYPDFDDYFEVDGNEVLWSENAASEGEYEDYIITNQILNVNPKDNAINERRLSYTTAGLRNKQEIALVTPNIEPWGTSDEIHFGDAGEGRAVAWMRFGDTTDVGGNRVLVIDEIQSKRHQDARDMGYAGVDNLTAEQQPNGIWHIYKDGVFVSPVAKWAADTPEKAIRQYERMNRVPAAPFEKNWAELAMKRMLRYAAENGYDKVAWTTGEQQADRYNMSTSVSKISRRDNNLVEGKRFMLGGNTVLPHKITINDEGIVISSTLEGLEGKPLADVVGKEMAVKMMQMENNTSLEDADLKIGGSGMKTFYDTMLVNFMNKYGKKWGVEVGEVTMPELEENNTMHSVDVTPAMRESVMQGQPMFSIKDVPSLVGIHNLSLEKLRKVIKMGGSLANPSVAVVDIDKSDHSDYGDYSLILPKHLVDSRLGRNAGTWAGDAWTPTYPSVVKRIKKSADITRFYKDINKMPSPISSKVALDFNSYLENRSANALYYWYLFDKGDAPELREIPSKFPVEIRDALERITNGSFSMFGLTPEQRAECVDVYVAYKYDGDRAKYEENLQHILEVSQKLVDNKNGLVARKAQQDLESIKEYGFDYDLVARFIRDVEYDVRHSGQVDTDATIRAAQEQVQQNGLESDFEKWKESLDSKYGIEEFIFDGYTPSGSQKWLPHTTENASKWMKKQGRVAATGTFPSFGMFIATVIPRMASLESIRKRKKQLGNSQEVYDAFKDKWEDTYYNLGKKLQPDAHTFEDYGWWRLMEAATKPNPQKYIKEQYNIVFSDEDMATLNTLLDAIKKEYPAKYFETKFERPVALSEFAAAVVPDTIPVSVEEYLRSANLNVYKYDKSVEGSKREVTLKAVDSPNVRFSLKNTPAAAVMDQKRAEYKNLTEEYNDLLQNKDKNPNFDEALNEWRGRKIDVVRDYLSAFAEDLGIQELSVLDVFNSKGDRDVYGTIVDLWCPEQLTEEEREEAIDELMDPKLAGFHIEQSNGVFIDISHSDNFSLNGYEAVYIHEFTHIENEKLSRGTLEELYEENKDWIRNKGNKTLKDYIEREIPGWGLAEELIAQSMHRLQQRGALEAYVNGAITPEEAMSVLKHTTPLMRDILIYKLNQHKEYVDRANKETGDNGGVHYGGSSHLEREGGKNENPAVLDGGRSSVEEDEEFVEVDIQDLIDRGEDFEILLPDNARFSIKKVEPSVRTLPTAEQMESELKEAGVAPEEIAKRIKEETGWYRNDKGHWSYKISKNPSWNDNIAPKSTSLSVSTDTLFGETLFVNEKLSPEEKKIVTKAKSDGTFLKAPNGQPSNLTIKQWAFARTKGFIEWFGDWINDPENASKVVDENGEPKMVYHTTKGEFGPFSSDKVTNESNFLGNGFYYSSTASKNDEYALKVPMFINAKKPLILDDSEVVKELRDKFKIDGVWTKKSSREYTKWVKKSGYDSVLAATKFGDSVVVYDNKQIIPATGRSVLDHTIIRISTLVNEITALYNRVKNSKEFAHKAAVEIRKSIPSYLVEVMGKREFDNLIRITEEALTKEDLETALRQVGEQLVSLEESHLRKEYNKMMALKLEGTNPRGVSVSRWVDETAREAINTFKDCLEKGKSAAVLEAEFREEWQFGENKKARNPWAMWSAMDLLQRHAEWMSLDEDIEQIDAEIQEKRQENSELFREGRAASANGDKTEAIACYRQIKKNKEEIADLLAERLQKAEARNNAMVYMNRNLDETITMGRSVFAEQKAQREMRRAEIVKMGIIDCIDLKNPTPSQDAERTRMQNFGLALKNFLIAPAYSMNTMLKVISINAPQGEGRLYDHFVRGERGYMAAMANFNAGYNEAMKIYADKAKEIFGKDYEKVLSESDKDSNITVQVINGKRVEEFVLPYGTAMYVYMVNKMVDGRVKLSKMGISEEVVDNMVKAMPYEYIQMADWIQEEYLPMLREKYNETHLECFGVPMAKVDNYVPLKILQSKIYKEVDGSGMDTTTLPTAIVGSIVKRTRNTLPIDLHVNAFEVIREHVENMEHWNAYTFVIQDMNALLSSTEFRRMIEHQNPGLFQRLKEAAQIAAGTYRDEPTAVDKGFGALNKLAASSKIAFRVNTAIKQILSYPAFASYAMSADFFANLMRNLSPDVWKSNFDWAIENVPGFKARWESRSAGNEKLSQATMAEFDKIIKKVNNIGMWPNAFVDALTCANGAKAVYDYRVDFYKERGYEEAEAQRLAKIDAAEAMNATQQSSEGLFISSLQAKRDLFSVAISTFQNSNFAYLRKQVEAIYEFKRDYETEVEYLIKKYTDSGMSEEEAAELAVKDVRKAKVKAAADLAVFTFGLNVLWWFGNNVWKYAFGDDDDREEIEDEVWMAFALSSVRNSTIGSMIESIAGGFGANPSVFFSDLAQTVNEIQYIAENDPKSWNKSAAYITARILVTNGIGVDLTTFANIYQGVASMIRDGYDVEDLMNILNAPQSQARHLAGKPKDGETLDEYIARMAFVHKRLKSKVDKKDLSRWERDYIAGQQRKLLVENDYSSTDYAEYTKQANAIRQEMGVTRSGKLNEDARFEFKHSDATEKAFTKEVMRYTRKINALQKQLDKMVVFNDAYLQKMLQIQNLRKELIEKYEQHND